MENNVEFFTATCLNWQKLLDKNEYKEIIIDSLRFLVCNSRIWLYGFVLMPNHVHILWCKQDTWLLNIQQSFLKFTAQQIKFKLLKSDLEELEKYKSTQRDRAYHFWERRPYSAIINKRSVASQKLDYMHWNPVKAGVCQLPEDYFILLQDFMSEASTIGAS